MSITNSIYMVYTISQLDTLLERYDKIIENTLQLGSDNISGNIEDLERTSDKMETIQQVIDWKEEHFDS